MPIFARNEQIHQELDARQRKRKIEAEEDRQAWSQLDQRRAVLVQRYNKSTQEAHCPDTDYQRTKYRRATQWPNASSHNYLPPRPEYEINLISIDENAKETTHNGVALTAGRELL